VINPGFKDLVNFIPAVRLDYGKDLGSTWAEGLSINARWGTTDPERTRQNGHWQVGARIHEAPVPVSTPVNQPPIISISSPVKSTGFTTPATITIDASASDPDGTVTKVEFYNGTTKLGERATAPWSFTWKDVREGSYSITAAATDNSNARSTSEPVTVVVEKAAQAINQLPSIFITSPLMDGSINLPASVNFTANASDPDGSVVKVEFYIGENLAGECLTSPYSVTLNFDTAGTYVITAKVFDNLNASAVSEPVSITLNFTRLNNDLLIIYPNPTNGAFTVDLTSLPEDTDPHTVSIVSLSGRTVYSDLYMASEKKCNIDISDAPGGIYIIMASIRGKVLSSRQFIKR
jgi:hypothetical protein